MIPRTVTHPVDTAAAPAPHQERTPTTASGRRSRLAARLRGGALDRALLAGADPSASAALAARASLLTSRRSRDEIAQSLDALVRRAQGPQRRWWDLSQREAILENSSQLQAVAMMLTHDRPLYAAGVAHLRQLLTDGTGPAYRGSASALARALSDARAELQGSD
ncbi:MAG TPA: hypothetical protein VGN08_03790 [Solirubrobacteraceae bacterium]|jgi:hypothetical protein